MSSSEARAAFLDYFADRQHRVVASSSLVPANDPTLLFANSGMVQFKDVFLGKERRAYRRATTSQKCLRVSGKHNDLEEVGPSPQHHTFFEMLGNFSFGDYFKLEAMQMAWGLLTDVYGLPAERLAVTVYEKDDDSYDLWRDTIGIDSRRIARLGPDDNFWQMAETGPCGPNSEIHWDRYPEQGEAGIIPSLEADDGRFIELWNLVFMQFNRTQPDPQHSGAFDLPLPAPGVDTGLGLERITSILQRVEVNYDTDLFLPLIRALQALTGHSDAERDDNIVPYRVISDHMRSAVFLIADGVLPGPKGRDSVTRLVIRRAARFGRKLGFDGPFLAQIADAVIDVMGGHFVELVERQSAIGSVITREEERFHRTLGRGLGELDDMLSALQDSQSGTLPGEQAFYLTATRGLPLEVIRDVASERQMDVDLAGFEAAQQRHARVSGAGQAMGAMQGNDAWQAVLADLQGSNELVYDPYGPLERETRLLALLQGAQPLAEVIAGDRVELVLAETPFYVEAGGQVADRGVIAGDGWLIDVEDARQPVDGLVILLGEVIEGRPRIGDPVRASVDAQRRRDVTRNHSATHLLHAALRHQLGDSVQQRGSLVEADRLRFDFAHDGRVSDAELRRVEAEVNDAILSDFRVQAAIKPLAEARAEGAIALFGEKYGDSVRTIRMGDRDHRYSFELCGGLHVASTQAIGQFRILSEGSVSAGVRRVEAVTGRAALGYVQDALVKLGEIASSLGGNRQELPVRLAALQAELGDSRRERDALRRKLAHNEFVQRLHETEFVGELPFLIARMDSQPMEALRELADIFRQQVPGGVLVLGSVYEDRPLLLVSIGPERIRQGLHAGQIIRPLAKRVGGGGGGRPNLAQAGGKNAEALPQALADARALITDHWQPT
ncbi:MAG: alanine--tRNA ligase [Anaerolineae bacterium]|nr:alanine--tRNA ligase [Anaerolineae bacterium]